MTLSLQVSRAEAFKDMQPVGAKRPGSHHGPRYRYNRIYLKCQGIMAGHVRKEYNYRHSSSSARGPPAAAAPAPAVQSFAHPKKKGVRKRR